MSDNDFAGSCALEACNRAGRVLPVLQAHLENEGLPLLTKVQQVALASVLLVCFDGITDSLERMVVVKDILDGFAPSLGDEAQRWLADHDGTLN